jgi:hypothetical protein
MTTEQNFMAHPNCDQRRQAVERILSAGISIGTPEAKVLSVLYGCSTSAIKADVRLSQTGVSDHTPQRLTTEPLQ